MNKYLCETESELVSQNICTRCLQQSHPAYLFGVICGVKVGSDGETPGYARPPSSIVPVGPTDKRVLELGRSAASSARTTRSSNLYSLSRHRSAACLLM